MRVIFGVLSLLIVLAIVGSLAKKNLQAFGGSGGVAAREAAAARQAAAASEAAALGAEPSRDGRTVAVPGGMPSAMAADVSGLTVPQQSKAMQDKIRDDTARALQQGAERTQRADPN